MKSAKVLILRKTHILLFILLIFSSCRSYHTIYRNKNNNQLNLSDSMMVKIKYKERTIYNDPYYDDIYGGRGVTKTSRGSVELFENEGFVVVSRESFFKVVLRDSTILMLKDTIRISQINKVKERGRVSIVKTSLLVITIIYTVAGIGFVIFTIASGGMFL